MTPVPFDLPLRTNEAAALADLLYQVAEPRRTQTPGLPAEVRQRFTGRLGSLDLGSIRVYPGSLQADPIHPSSYFVAVDGIRGESVAPLLLRIAPASSPATGLFPKSILIGRMRPAGGREIVVNAIPFAPADLPALTTYVEQVDRAFLPRPQGLQPALILTSSQPELVFPTAIDAFRALGRSHLGLEASWSQILWAVIRCGWRDGYTACTRVEVTDLEAARAALELLPGFTRYTLVFDHYDGPTLAAAESLFDHIRRVKLALPAGAPRSFDLEIPNLPEVTEQLRAAGRSAIQAPPDGRVRIEPGEDPVERIAEGLRTLSGRGIPETASVPPAL